MSIFERYAEKFVLKRRLERFRSVLDERTLRLIPVLEDIQKAHNASAVIRTCDAFGLAEINFITQNEDLILNPRISMGSDNWVEKRVWPKLDDCVNHLRERGYLLVGTSPHEKSSTLDDLPLDRPLALFFGNERDGLSPEALSACDLTLHIPTRGFVESLNLSVSFGIIAHHLLERIRREPGLAWRLPPPLRKKLMRRWIFNSTRVGGIIRRIRERKNFSHHDPIGDSED